jgi:CHASE2 domain-containing sensor protein
VFEADAAQLRDWLAGKVVLVGDLRGTTDRYPYPDGRSIAGCYMHATGIEMLLADWVVRVPGALATPLILVGGALLGVLAVLMAGNSRARCLVAVLVLAGALCLASVGAYRLDRILCNPLAPISALVLAALFAAFIRRQTHASV